MYEFLHNDEIGCSVCSSFRYGRTEIQCLVMKLTLKRDIRSEGTGVYIDS